MDGNIANQWARSSLRVLMVGVIGVTVGCSSPPPLGDDPRAVKLTDAMMTAFAAKRPDLVDQCATDLDRLQREGAVSEDAAKSFRSMIDTARKGEWKSAFDSARSFVRGQRK